MKFKSFKEFKKERTFSESTENDADSDSNRGDKTDQQGLSTRITLGENNNFKPFIVSDDAKSEHFGKNRNFAPLIRAFKTGANWGWTKDSKSGEDKPVKISGKKLYLCGGAVRDFLVGKKPRNTEMATDASPDEIYKILRQNDFTFCSNEVDNKKTGKMFWVSKENSDGRPVSFSVKVNTDLFEIDCFRRTPRGLDKDNEMGGMSDDANSRDFTINGLYLLLNNENGPNKELTDFHGGVHHLNSKQIMPIGNLEDKLTEDPKRLMRLLRFINSYGDLKNIPAEHQAVIKKLGPGLLTDMDQNTKIEEFRKGLSKEDSDGRKYLKSFQKMDLLPSLFPNMDISDDLPVELSEIGDKHMPIAWMLRNNPVSSLGDLKLDDNELKKISFLIKSLHMSDELDPNNLMDLVNDYTQSGISVRKLKDWGTKIGKKDPDLFDAFSDFAKSPRVQVYVSNDGDGSESISEPFADLVDPFNGLIDSSAMEDRKKNIEFHNFRKFMKKYKPS